MSKKKQEAEQVTPPPRSRRRLLMTKAEWEKVSDANARAERDPDPAQLLLLDLPPTIHD